MPTLVQAKSVPKVPASILTLYPQVLPVTAIGLIVTLPVDNFLDNLWTLWGFGSLPVDFLWITFWGAGGCNAGLLLWRYPLAYKKD
jgi:hypothetical protein